MADGIFPTKDADFNTYLGNVAPYLNTNSVRLVVDSQKLVDLGTLKGSWDTKYPQSKDPNTATKTIIDEKIALRGDIEDLLREIYYDIPKSALIAADRNTLNLKERKPNTPRPAITTAPNLDIKSLGGLEILVECRVEGDETRPSIHTDADGLEFRSKVSSKPPVSGGTPPPVGTPAGNDDPPANYSEAPDVSFSSKARFIRILGDPTMKGKYLYVFVRWINITDHTKSGPWSEMVFVLIS